MDMTLFDALMEIGDGEVVESEERKRL